jgi:cytosine/adenosine deaminase-related metal-dependent hydrolase
MRIRLKPAEGPVVDLEDDRIVPPFGNPGLVLALGTGELRPGLINAHDHLHSNHVQRLGRPPYQNAYAWGEDLHGWFAGSIARSRAVPRPQALLFGALKNILGGATTVVHHDPWEEAFSKGFPVRVPRIRTAHSLKLEPDLLAALKGDPGAAGAPLAIHLAEGTDGESESEVRAAEQHGLLSESLLAIHCVGVNADGIARLKRSRAAVVWCPTSNEFLYGKTAPAALFASGIDVLLGTDALLSGEGTLLDELRAARRHHFLGDNQLEAAVSVTAARRIGLPKPSLAAGSAADIVFLRRPLFDARPKDVALVLVGGRPVLADEPFAEVFAKTGVAAQKLTVGGVAKRVVVPLARIAEEALAVNRDCGRILR